MPTFDFDSYIKHRFQLFDGNRSHKEDQKIYHKIYNLCTHEMIKFASENLKMNELNKLAKRLKSEDPKKAFAEAIEHIPGVKPRLNARLRYFVDQLLLDSLMHHKNR